MKKIVYILTLSLLFCRLSAQEIFISEYVEGSSYNKAIELYNPSNRTINLSGYEVLRDTDGKGDYKHYYRLSGELKPKSTWVIVYHLADSFLKTKADAICKYDAMAFNGDDQISLRKEGVEIDHFGISGDISFGKNVTYIRKPYALVPKLGQEDPRNSNSWIRKSRDDVSNLKLHDMGSPINLLKTSLNQKDKNYITTTTPQKVYESLPEVLDSKNFSVAVQYYDGLGRPSQTVAVGASTSGKDIVTPIVYDGFGREHKKYLPYVEESARYGTFRNQAEQGAISYYQNRVKHVEADAQPYARTVFENSPLNRVLKQGAVGTAFQPENGHAVSFAYKTNSRPIAYWEPNSDASQFEKKHYAPSTLYLNETTDENGILNREYKDLQGRVVLKEANVNGKDRILTKTVRKKISQIEYVDKEVLIYNLAEDFPNSLDEIYSPQDKNLTKVLDANGNIVHQPNGQEVIQPNPSLLITEENRVLEREESLYMLHYFGYDFLALFVALHPWFFEEEELLEFFEDKTGAKANLFKYLNYGGLSSSGDGYREVVSLLFDYSQLLIDEGISESLILALRAMVQTPVNNYEQEFLIHKPELLENLNVSPKLFLKFLHEKDIKFHLKQKIYNIASKEFIDNYVDQPIFLEQKRVPSEKFVEKNVSQDITNLETSAKTYYNYDIYGNLVLVIPPAAAADEQINAEEIKQYCYRYQYDGRNRMITKQLPGAKPVAMCYNGADQLVATQDGERAKLNQWLFTKYDAFGRVVQTGIYNSSKNQTELQKEIDSHPKTYESWNGSNYTNQSFPKSATSLLTENYYDNYDFNKLGRAFHNKGYSQTQQAERSLTFLTGSKIKNLETGEYYTTINYYDWKGQLIQSHSQNHLKGWDVLTNEYDFTGKLTRSLHEHSVFENSSKAYSDKIEKKFEYDHAGRLLSLAQKLNEGSFETITQNSYNELGKLIATTTPATTKEFKYTIRDWVKEIKVRKAGDSDLVYKQELDYNKGADSPFNGNISAIHYSVGAKPTQDWNFTYDGLNRLVTSNTTGSHYNSQYAYDLNGNILSLERNGKTTSSNYGTVDNLDYRYKGNQLDVVHNHISSSYTDRGFQNLSQLSTGEYAYDANGNMTQDLNKNIAQISYNLLNLPSNITVKQKGSIAYAYDAGGAKLSKTVKSDLGSGTTQTTDYVGNHIYKDDKLDYIITDNGRLVANYGSPSVAEGRNLKGFTQEYNITDHLGNVRLVLNDKKEVIQENSYYPFGMQINSLAYNSKSGAEQNKYLYNGKEKQSEFGLDWLDYGARFLDNGRWNGIDNKAEKYYSVSPYVYALNNPIVFIDPDGNEVKYVQYHDPDGVRVIRFNAGIKFQHSSDVSTQRANKHIKPILNQIENSFKGYDEKTNTRFETKAKVDNSKDNNFVIKLTDDIVKVKRDGTKVKAPSNVVGTTEKIGNPSDNTMQVDAYQDGDDVARTGAHEFGHSVSLRHLKGESDPRKSDDSVEDVKSSPNNLMRQSQNGSEITTKQLYKIYEMLLNYYKNANKN